VWVHPDYLLQTLAFCTYMRVEILVVLHIVCRIECKRTECNVGPPVPTAGGHHPLS